VAGFSKSERLHLKKDIALLFEKGEKWNSYPFRILLTVEKDSQDGQEIAMLVSVAKRNFKKASDRNRIKRQIREAYRLNKDVLYTHAKDRLSEIGTIKIHIGLIYTAKSKETWELIQNKVRKSIQEICQKTI